MLVGPKQEPERGSLLRPLQSLLRGREPAQMQGLLRLPDRWPLRYEGRVQLKAQLREPDEAQVRMDERAQVRGPVIIRERGQERPSYPHPERRLLRTPKHARSDLRTKVTVYYQDIGNT